jgi:hypothetical protein
MPSHDAKHAPALGRRLSRRSVLAGAATAGLAATAMAAAAGPAAAAVTSSSSPHKGGEVKAPSGPIVVHVRNATSGDIEVFSGTSQTRLRDAGLAARIARAIG